MPYTDKSLTCADCGNPFTFTAGEQEFHASKGFTNEPRRCTECRNVRRESRGGGGSREMFTTTCANCGGSARVPFEPRGDRPVYCSDCFRPAGGGSRPGGGGGGWGRSGDDDRGGRRW
ncbi:MAG TPA: zinc-ribbon domain containing protein [Dehalococcoidia bacterium]|nr:zinc-ribbon domain containing protein [Dehalococcoidia bacterium]